MPCSLFRVPPTSRVAAECVAGGHTAVVVGGDGLHKYQKRQDDHSEMLRALDSKDLSLSRTMITAMVLFSFSSGRKL